MENFILRSAGMDDESKILSFRALLDSRAGSWFRSRKFEDCSVLEREFLDNWLLTYTAKEAFGKAQNLKQGEQEHLM